MSDIRTLGWVGGGVVLEGAVGCLVAFLLSRATNLTHVETGAAAGLGASAILRQRFADIGSTGVGVVYFYDRIRGLIQRTVARRAASRYAIWKSAARSSLLAANKVQELGQRLVSFVSAVGGDDVHAAAEGVTNLLKVKTVLEETGTNAEEKLDGLLELARDFDALVVVRDLYCEITGQPFERIGKRAWVIAGTAAFVACAAVAALVVSNAGTLRVGRAVLRQPLRLHHLLFIAERAETATHVSSRTRADGVYVIVKVLLGNESSAPVLVGPSDFSLQTMHGDVVRPARSPAAVLRDPIRKSPLNTEERQTGLLAFDVPPDELKGLQLRITAPGGPPQGAPSGEEGRIDLNLKSSAPPLLAKSFRGGAEPGVRIGFVSAPRQVRHIAVDARRRCRFSGTSVVQPDGGFLVRAPSGLQMRGHFISSVEATGDLLPPRLPRHDPCLPKLRKPIGWTAQARP